MTEMSDQLTEKASKHFNESMRLVQAGKLEEALESLEEAEKIAHEADYDVVLLHTLKSKGQVLESLGRLDEALETYTSALKINEELLEKDPTNDFYTVIFQTNMNNIGNLGNLLRQEGKFQASKKCYETGLETCQKRLKYQPQSNYYQMYCGNTHNNLGELLAGMGQTEEAKENYEKSLKITDKLLIDFPGDFEYLSDKVMTLNNLGILFSEQGKKEEAKEYFEKALKILEGLHKDFPNNERVKEELNLTRERLERLERL
jgi:tetratricopeptide (TPR) repeat protein